MAKSNKQSITGRVQRPVLTAFIVGYIGWSLTNSTNKALSDITNAVYQILGGLLVLIAIDIYLERKHITHQQIIKLLGLCVSSFVIMLGWKLCSYSEAPYFIQNDGYNVTGGFLMLAGGFYWGYDFAQERLRRGKK